MLPDGARLSCWLSLLIEAQRGHGVTQTSVAKLADMQSCNLSAFINSNGKVRNASELRLGRALYAAGLHGNGVLVPGLHRWDLLGRPESERTAFLDILNRNHPTPDASNIAMRLVQITPEWAFLMLRATSEARVMARVSTAHARELARAFAAELAEAGKGEGSALQTMWSMPQTWMVERMLDHYLSNHTIPMTAMAT